MKIIKRFIAMMLCLLLTTVFFCSCHPKDEVAFTIGGVDIKTSLYLCKLIDAYLEGQQKVYEDLSEKAKDDSSIDLNHIHYFEQKIEETDFATWIKNKAIENIKTFAAVEIKFKELNLSLSSEDIDAIDQYADMYWTSYGYAEHYEKNGVSFNTFKEALSSSYKKDTYFMAIYGKGGSSALPENEVDSVVLENFELCNIISASFVDSQGNLADTTTQESVKAQFQDFENRINKGTPFSEIYIEYYGQDKANVTEPNDSGSVPTDKYAEIVGSKGTSYESEYYDIVKGLKVGQAKMQTSTESVTLLVKSDLSSDKYHKENLYSSGVYILKEEEFNDSLKSVADALTFKENSFATGRINPKDLDSHDHEHDEN